MRTVLERITFGCDFSEDCRSQGLSTHSNALFAKTPLKVRARMPDNDSSTPVERKTAMTRTIDDEDIGRMIDIIGDGDLTAEAPDVFIINCRCHCRLPFDGCR